MTFAMPLAEQKLKESARVMQSGMWLLFLAAIALAVMVRRSGSMRSASIWILGCAVLAFLVSFALRDMLRKIGHRHTENKLVDEVKTYLRTAPAIPVIPIRNKPEVVSRPVEDCVPARANEFLQLKDAAVRMPATDLVVFDAIPVRDNVTVRTDFYAILLPVRPAC